MYNSINYKMWPKWSFRDWREIRDEIQILSTLIYITVIFNPLIFELHLFEEKAYVILNSIYNSLELYPVPLSGMKIQIAIHWRTSASCQLKIFSTFFLQPPTVRIEPNRSSLVT